MASRGPGRRSLFSPSLGTCPVEGSSSWIPGAPSHPPFSNSPFLPTSTVRGRFRKRGQSTASAHTLPTETISEPRPWLPSSSVQFGRYFNRGGEFPGAPQRKCPMSGNVCFHFLLPSMNSTHGNGLGLDQIHTEANQKHLFLEINLSLGNELYIHLWGDPRTRTHTGIYIMYHRQNTCANPQAGSPELLGRGGNRLVGFKGHLKKSGLVGKLNDR